MKHLKGKKITKDIDFMGETVKVKKLSVNEVLSVQAVINKLSKSKDDKAQLAIVRELLRTTVEGAEDMTDDEFNEYPLAELTSLVEKCLEFSGMGNSQGN